MHCIDFALGGKTRFLNERARAPAGWKAGSSFPHGGRLPPARMLREGQGPLGLAPGRAMSRALNYVKEQSQEPQRSRHRPPWPNVAFNLQGVLLAGGLRAEPAVS